MKIIFLDIDGVMNKLSELGGVVGPTINKKKVALLNQLSDIKDIAIVISSSWRTEAVKPLKDAGLEIPILGCTPQLFYPWACRGNEIEKYMTDTYNYEDADFEYVILDDVEYILYSQIDNFVKVNMYDGLTQENVDKVREILTKYDE